MIVADQQFQVIGKHSLKNSPTFIQDEGVQRCLFVSQVEFANKIFIRFASQNDLHGSKTFNHQKHPTKLRVRT